MHSIIGRFYETDCLKEYATSAVSEFVVVYGRRRVGKTFLIRETFENNFHFYLTGKPNSTTELQLQNFVTVLKKHYPKKKIKTIPINWHEAFQLLIDYLEKVKAKQKLIFIDELPWLDTHKSDFLSSFEHFWNHWASARKDIKLIVCGSAASWITNKLINNKGGLHNRVTQKIKLLPFTLQETELFLQSKNIRWNHYQIIEVYMAMGGIPYYLNGIKRGKSATQNIEDIYFKDTGLLRNEFDNLYASLFRFAENHIELVKIISKKTKGLTREEIIKSSKLQSGGGTTRVLEELEQCGFIRKYIPFDKKERDTLYQITDFYTLFYFNFIFNKDVSKDNYWAITSKTPQYRAWSGYAFEQVCTMHLPQIKKELGIAGIMSNAASWRNKNAQIDLLIDRNDQVINICEMKFSINSFTIDKKYADNLRNKIGSFTTQSKTRKAVFLTLVTTYGVTDNAYSSQLVDNTITMDALFIK
jgi:uncharacterized protein